MSSAIATSPTAPASTRSSPRPRSVFGKLDFVLHCIAFSDKDELTGRYVDTTEANFTKSLLISCYSFTAIAQRAEKLMGDGGSLLTLTYYGAEKWMPHYNVMGVAKAALEASVRYMAADLGPRRSASTPSRPGRSRRWRPPASATSATSCKLERVQRAAAPHRDHRRGRRQAVYLLSDLSRGVTGEILHDPPCGCRLPRRRHEEPCRASTTFRSTRAGESRPRSRASACATCARTPRACPGS
jgi:enoyl-[acyl-carrier-protein] reductase (NADH)